MDLDAIEARANAATEGPLRIEVEEFGRVILNHADRVVTSVSFTNDAQEKADAEFIVAAFGDVPALVARVRELEEENEKLRTYLSHAVKFTFGNDMASHAEVTRAEQNRPDAGGSWLFRSWGPTERHATQEAALNAALARARDIAKETCDHCSEGDVSRSVRPEWRLTTPPTRPEPTPRPGACAHHVDELIIGKQVCDLDPGHTDDHQSADGTLWENLTD